MGRKITEGELWFSDVIDGFAAVLFVGIVAVILWGLSHPAEVHYFIHGR